MSNRRLSRGSFYNPALYVREVQARAQLYYLRALDHGATFIIEDLLSSVLPAFENLVREVFNATAELIHPKAHELTAPFIRTGSVLPVDFRILQFGSCSAIERLGTSFPSTYRPFVESFEEWSGRHNVLDTWLKDRALGVLTTWVMYPDHRKSPRWLATAGSGEVGELFDVEGYMNPFRYDAAVAAFEGEPATFSVQFPGWDPLTSSYSRSEIDALYDQAYDREKARYLDRQEQIAEGAGLTKGPMKRELDSHLNWLVLYQHHGLSHGQIVQQVGFGRKTVEDAINKAAELIGLTLRPRSKPGRKKFN